MSTPSRIFGFGLAVIVLAVVIHASPQSSPAFEWKTATPESAGVSSTKIASFEQLLAAHRTKAFLVILDDRIVGEWYAPDFSARKLHYTASMAKAVVGGVAAAVAISDGRMKLDDPAANYIPQWRGDPVKSRITLRQLGSHTSGLDDAEGLEGNHQELTDWKGDFWKRLPSPRDPFTLARDVVPVVYPPGTSRRYSNPGIAMLGYATTVALKDGPEKDLRTLLRERVMRPIGVADEDWEVGYGQTVMVDGWPLVGSWGGGGYTARATARLARLMLHEGEWEGRRVIKASAVRAVTQDSGTPGPGAIGWWSNNDGHVAAMPRDAYWGAGAEDQLVLIIPSLKLIAVRYGGSLDPTLLNDPAADRWFFTPLMAAIGKTNMQASAPSPASWPDSVWPVATPAEAGMSAVRLEQARDYALQGGGSGMILRHGKVVMTWGDQTTRYDLKSSSKAIGVTLLGTALQDGKVQLDDPAINYQPSLGVPPESNRATDWLDQITLRQLANQTAGFEKPGGYGKLLFAPGTKWFYSDAGPNWLAECLTLVYRRDLNDVMFERVFEPIGVTPQDIEWRENAFRPHEIAGMKRREFGSGFSANMNAMARIGCLYLREGRWRDEQIIPAEFVRLARQPASTSRGLPEYDQSHGNASEHYSLLWWNNGDGTIPGLPRDAFWSWGLYNSHILVIPSLDIVAVRAGDSWKITSDEHYDVLKPFFEPIAASVRDFGKKSSDTWLAKIKAGGPPYSPSSVIKRVTWAPVSEIVRRAPGGDNWPMTWGDDDALYTAYGDGNGFEPFVPEKLSLGFARVTGGPENFHGTNFAAVNGDFAGDGRAGRKASGILMVDGVLYVLARNLDNAQLGWSRDHGATWTWADWKFTTSFGCPTFLNFGKNYAGARDGYVYVYSFDSDTAYEAADRMVLARVPTARIAERDAYDYFVARDAAGAAEWSRDITRRGAVFTNPGACFRGGISYDAGLKRYLWCQILPHSTHPQGQRFQGGFGIYDAPEPWGPWTTVFYSTDWDTGPGESSSFPTKWMSADGRTLHLVFSGNDSFSVRQTTFHTEATP